MEWLLSSFDEDASKFGQGLGFYINFTQGIDNILHLATRTSGLPQGLYAHLVECLGYLEQDINAKDCDSMTALEIAARKADSTAVRTLLQAGASFEPCSTAQETTLHVSMLHWPSYMVTAELLPHAREAGYLETEAYEKLHDEKVKLICHTIESSTSHWELRRHYKILRLILEDGKPGRPFVWSVDDVLKVLVETWSRNSPLLPPDFMNNRPLTSCKILLEAGADVFASSEECTECRDLAGITLFHQSSTALADLFVDNCWQGHVDGLVKRILAPCNLRIAAVDENRLLPLLDRLLSRQIRSPNDLLYCALDNTPDHLKVAFVNKILACQLSGDLRGPNLFLTAALIEKLTSIAEGIRWAVCEAILIQDAGFKFLWKERATQHHAPLSSMSRSDQAGTYLDYVVRRVANQDWLFPGKTILTWLHAHEGFTPSICGCGGRHLCFLKSQSCALEHQVQRCVVHVVTKMMVDPETELGKELPRKERVLWALELRRQFGLPDIIIDSSLLTEAITGSPEWSSQETPEALVLTAIGFI